MHPQPNPLLELGRELRPLYMLCAFAPLNLLAATPCASHACYSAARASTAAFVPLSGSGLRSGATLASTVAGASYHHLDLRRRIARLPSCTRRPFISGSSSNCGVFQTRCVSFSGKMLALLRAVA